MDIPGSQGEHSYGDFKGEISKKPQLSSSADWRNQEPDSKENDEEVRRCFSPGDMVELQVSLSEQTLGDAGCTALGSARGIERDLSYTIEQIQTTTTSHDVPSAVRKPLGQHGLVLTSPSMLGQVEVILQQPAASEAGRGIVSVGGPGVRGSVESQRKREDEGGVPGSFTVSFGIPSEEEAAEEQDSESEGDQDKPHKHRARHASE